MTQTVQLEASGGTVEDVLEGKYDPIVVALTTPERIQLEAGESPIVVELEAEGDG